MRSRGSLESMRDRIASFFLQIDSAKAMLKTNAIDSQEAFSRAIL